MYMNSLWYYDLKLNIYWRCSWRYSYCHWYWTTLPISNLKGATYISHITDSPGKSINPFIHISAMGKLDRLSSLTLVWQPVEEKKNLNSNHLKIWREIALSARLFLSETYYSCTLHHPPRLQEQWWHFIKLFW